LAHQPNWHWYEDLFAAAKPEHTFRIDASTTYLYSSHAITRILAYAPDARVIAMVRNPVDMVVLLHAQRLFDGDDNVKDFAAAWRLQPDRIEGKHLPWLCRTPALLQYGPNCRLGEQIERLFRTVPAEQQHVIILDDLKTNPHNEWTRLLRFLELDDDGRTEFPVHNAAKRNRSTHLRTTTRIVAQAKEALRLPRFRLGVLRTIDSVNRQEQPNDRIAPALRAELYEYFRDDVRLLGELLKRDFSGWLTSDAGR
jgi:hypothetical protein